MSSGRISINTQQLIVTDGSQVSASVFGTGQAGDILIRASDSVDISEDPATNTRFLAGVSADVQLDGKGRGGNLTIETKRLSIRNGAQVSASTLGAGNAGNLTVRASDSIDLSGDSRNFPGGLLAQVNADISTGQVATGNGGKLTIETGRLSVSDGSKVQVYTAGQGNAGDLQIRANEIEVFNTSKSRFFSTGIFAKVAGFSIPDSPVTIKGKGNAGNLTIETGQLSLKDGGQISTRTSAEGDGGTVTIQAEEIPLDGLNSRISSSVKSGDTGNAGETKIATSNLSVTNGGQIGAGTLGQGNGGNLTISAREFIKITGSSETSRSGIFAPALEGSGDGGDISIISDILVIEDEALISVSNLPSIGSRLPGTGTPGSINIEARSIQLNNQGNINANSTSGQGGNISIRADSLALDNGASISASTRAGRGEGSNIVLRANNTLLIRNNSRISAEALNNANGGNITINAPDGFVVAFPNQNNDIVANAAQGQGGNINITTESLFGIQERPLNPVTNDINASSEFGLQGNISINNPDVDPSRGLASLPAEVVDVTRLVARGCPGDGRSGGSSEFIVTGRGGLPPNPGDT